MTDNFWTPERVSVLTASWRAGHSAREIAAVIAAEAGRPITRNMVISKAHRLGLKIHQPSNSWRDKSSKRAAP